MYCDIVWSGGCGLSMTRNPPTSIPWLLFSLHLKWLHIIHVFILFFYIQLVKHVDISGQEILTRETIKPVIIADQPWNHVNKQCLTLFYKILSIFMIYSFCEAVFHLHLVIECTLLKDLDKSILQYFKENLGYNYYNV